MVSIDPVKAREVMARWESRLTRDENGCLIWGGARSSKGYGQVRLGVKMLKANRVALVAALGRDILDGLECDHLCNVPACVEASHLREATRRENLLAEHSQTITRLQVERTHCPRGHELAGDNLVPSLVGRGQRDCLTCHRERDREKAALISAAHKKLGLTKRDYVHTYGWSRAAALEVLDS
jgi:hypothetical protein